MPRQRYAISVSLRNIGIHDGDIIYRIDCRSHHYLRHFERIWLETSFWMYRGIL